MRIHDNRLTYGHQLTPRIWEDNSGYLICHDCILARTGSYDYLESEVLENGDPNKIIQVYRTPEEVFSPEAIASFENKPFCNEHPEDDVTPQNYKDLMVGTIRNVRRGIGNLENCLVGDVVVFDPDVMELIKNGDKRELSLGYNTDIIKDASGRYVMTNIRGNHLALVDSGRAGCATIRDSAKTINKIGGQNVMNKVHTQGKKFKYKMLDEDVFEVVEDAEPEEEIEVVEDDEPIPEEVPAEQPIEEPVKDDDDIMGKILAKLDKICEHLGLNEEEPVVDAEPIPEDDISEEVVADEEPIEEEEIVADEDDTYEVEELADDDEEVVATEEQNKAMDADVELPKMDACMKKDAAPKKDSGKAFAKLASVKDSKPMVTADEIQKSFQDRYNKAARI